MNVLFQLVKSRLSKSSFRYPRKRSLSMNEAMFDRLFTNRASHYMNWCWSLGEDLILSNALLNQDHKPIYYDPTL